MLIRWALAWQVGRWIGRQAWALLRPSVESYLTLWLCEALQTLSDTRTEVKVSGGSAGDSITRRALQQERLVVLLLAVIEEQVTQARAARSRTEEILRLSGSTGCVTSPIGGSVPPKPPSVVP